MLLGPGGADGVVLACPDLAAAEVVSRVATDAPGAARIAANLAAVAALGGRPAELRAQAAAMLKAGATELRFYHAGLGSVGDLAAIRDVTRALGTAAAVRSPSDGTRPQPRLVADSAAFVLRGDLPRLIQIGRGQEAIAEEEAGEVPGCPRLRQMKPCSSFL